MNNEYLKIIDELNNELYEKFGEDVTVYNFSYCTNGYADTIFFNEMMIWNSEIDEREFIEEINDYEPLKPHIKKIFNEEIEKLSKLKFTNI